MQELTVVLETPKLLLKLLVPEILLYICNCFHASHCGYSEGQKECQPCQACHLHKTRQCRDKTGAGFQRTHVNKLISHYVLKGNAVGACPNVFPNAFMFSLTHAWMDGAPWDDSRSKRLSNLWLLESSEVQGLFTCLFFFFDSLDAHIHVAKNNAQVSTAEHAGMACTGNEHNQN